MTTKTVFSKKTDYELFTLVNCETLDGEQLDDLKKMSDRYNIVDYYGFCLATANSLDKAIQTINRLHGWGVDCVIDEKMNVAWDIKRKSFGAGYEIVYGLTRRY